MARGLVTLALLLTAVVSASGQFVPNRGPLIKQIEKVKTVDATAWFPGALIVAETNGVYYLYRQAKPPLTRERAIAEGKKVAAGRRIALENGDDHRKFSFEVLDVASNSVTLRASQTLQQKTLPLEVKQGAAP